MLLVWPSPAFAELARPWFRDCAHCPRMVLIPAGDAIIGSPDRVGESEEWPARRVSVAAFALGQYEVTVSEWSAFVSATGRQDATCATGSAGAGTWRNPGFSQDPQHPVVCVTWQDARDYAAWLSEITGQVYRLPSEAEWEYAARAGTRTDFHWGAAPSRSHANYGNDQCCAPLSSGRDRWRYTAPVGSFAANTFGLYDMSGNVWEWIEDCYTATHAAAVLGACEERTIRGGSWLYGPRQMRSDARRRHHTAGVSIGFRVARNPS